MNKLIAQIFQGSTDSSQLDTDVGVTGIQGALEGSGITETGDFALFVVQLVNFILPYITLAAFVGFIYAGVLYVTAFGNDEQLQKSKKILIWSAIGILVVIVSFTLTQFLTGNLTDFIGNQGA